MMDLTESVGARTTTIMGGFIFMMVVHTVFIIILNKTSEDITTNATKKIMKSIVANILTNGTNIGGIPSNPQDMKIGGNVT